MSEIKRCLEQKHLAQLWQQQARVEEARGLLTPIYDWFTEGLDTRNPKQAKSLLEALG